MKKLILTIALAVMALSAIAAHNKIPMDPAVRKGSLPNGLTYYIRHNESPEKRADFFLAQKVGSVNEEENQRGLAHFLEHLCFNGSKHFPGNSLISYLESIGVKFGANLNAYTSTDETVYNICQVPAERVSALDSCLLILRDWCHDLSLNPEDIDKERGVIKGEWRQRQGNATNRMLEKAAPEIYAGSRYGERLPIGKMEVVENCQYSDIRDYYEKWYHPENQCVIVVGDIDIDRTENKIKEMFSDIPIHNPEPLPADCSIPDNDKMIVSVQSDPEQANSMIQLYIKHHGIDTEGENTIEEIRRDYVASLVASMLAERFDEIENSPESPFSNLGVGDVKFLLARDPRAFVVRAMAKKGRENECLELYARELKRAVRHGFLDSELQRAKLDYRTGLESRFTNRENVENTTYARKYVNHFLNGGVLVSEEAFYKMMKGVERTTTTEHADNYIRDLVNDLNRNLVVLAYLPDGSEGVTPESLEKAYLSVNPAELGAYVDNTNVKPILPSLPSPGSIVAESAIDNFGAELWTLSNGIKIYSKKTTAKPDQIIVMGHSPGGFSQNYDPAKAADYLVCNDLLKVSGFGGHSSSELRKMLIGKKADAQVAVGNMDETLSVVTTPSDLETAMQMIYLKATSPEKDEKAFATFIEGKKMKFDSNASNPTFEMGDSIHSNVYSRHPLGCKLQKEDLPLINYDNILAIHKERFSDMSDFSFFIIGNFDRDSLKTMAERYLAALPGGGRNEKPKDIGYRYASKSFKKVFSRKMQTPSSITYTFFNGNLDYNLNNVIKCHALGQVLKTKLLQDIREDKGWTYSIQTHCGLSAGMNGDDPAKFIMPVYIKVEPGKENDCLSAVAESVESLSKTGYISDEELLKVKQYMVKSSTDNETDNSYWLTVLRMFDKFGKDMHTGYADITNSLTAEDLRVFAGEIFPNATRIQLVMQPE